MLKTWNEISKPGSLNIVIPDQYTRFIGIASFVVLICLGAHIKIFTPFTPVPFTLQTFFVLLAGVMLSPRDSVAAVLSYILLGVIGLPVFAAGGLMGLAYLMGPTAGYLLGFIIAAFVISYMTQKNRSAFSLAVALIAGELIIFGFGFIHLAVSFGMGFNTAYFAGVAPFIIGDTLKVVSVWALVSGMTQK